MTNVQKILFLDFDGVINRSSDFYNTRKTLPVNEACLNRVLRFVTENNLKVVLSTSHRSRYTNAQAFAYDIGELADYLHSDWRTGRDPRGMRGNEVRQWLLDHPEVDNYIILDDDSDFYAYQPFIQTHMNHGFTELDLIRAQEVLESQEPRNVRPLGVADLMGDMLQSRCLAVAHGCNAQAKMNSGVAKAIRTNHVEAYHAYMEAAKIGLNLGDVSWAESASRYNYRRGLWIANIITQKFYGYDGKQYVSYDAIQKGLTTAATQIKERNFYEIGLPRIGSDRGGGDWEVIKGIITDVADATAVKFTIFTLE